jgi:hypothetical protein
VVGVGKSGWGLMLTTHLHPVLNRAMVWTRKIVLSTDSNCISLNLEIELKLPPFAEHLCYCSHGAVCLVDCDPVLHEVTVHCFFFC